MSKHFLSSPNFLSLCSFRKDISVLVEPFWTALGCYVQFDLSRRILSYTVYTTKITTRKLEVQSCIPLKLLQMKFNPCASLTSVSSPSFLMYSVKTLHLTFWTWKAYFVPLFKHKLVVGIKTFEKLIYRKLGDFAAAYHKLISIQVCLILCYCIAKLLSSSNFVISCPFNLNWNGLQVI